MTIMADNGRTVNIERRRQTKPEFLGGSLPPNCFCGKKVKVVNTFKYDTHTFGSSTVTPISNFYFEVECDYGHNFYTG